MRDSTGRTLDHALVLWFPGPGSYSGEDSAELHLHGGQAVLAGVVEALLQLGLRPAEAGEFTRRAFLNGRLDLIEAEAIADLVDAETEAQRDQALRQYGGALSRIYQEWTGRVLRLLAQQEALIDFPDEDLPADVEVALLGEIDAVERAIAEHLDDGQRGERLRDGLVFAIVGAPNAGKSTLMNALAGRDVAIVSPMPGTTRDVLEARVILGGVPVVLLDTAGLRDATEPVEAEGVARARRRLADADLAIVVLDPLLAVEPDIGVVRRVLRVATKADLVCGLWPDAVTVSARTGRGMDELRAALERVAAELVAGSASPPLTRARHRAALSEARAYLGSARRASLPELRGEDLRLALHALSRLTGRTSVEDILDSVFRQFCIGK